MRRSCFRLLPFLMLISISINVSAQDNFFKKIRPHEITIQYAGNVGLMSFGPTWNYGNYNCLETTLLLGYIPGYGVYKDALCFSCRQVYTPWKIDIKNNINLKPVSIGVMASVISGKEYWIIEPSYYPDNYYGTMTRLRFHLLLGFQLDFDSRRKSVYFQSNTYDLAIINCFHSKYLKPKDIIGFAIGVKIKR